MATNLKRRLNALEQRRQTSPEPFRLIIGTVCGPTDLAKATCSRTMAPDGTLLEVVDLHGGCGTELSKEELNRFIESFPIVPLSRG